MEQTDFIILLDVTYKTDTPPSNRVYLTKLVNLNLIGDIGKWRHSLENRIGFFKKVSVIKEKNRTREYCRLKEI